MKKITLAEAAAIVSSADNTLLTTHEKPDGDAVGSTLALFSVMRENGLRADVFIPEPLPRHYMELASGFDILTDPAAVRAKKYSRGISVDNARGARAGVGKDYKFEELPRPLLNIDHHPDNELFGDENHVDPKAAAASLIVFRLIRELGWKISPRTATLLLTGIIMDTGGFKFDNTSPEALEAAARLLELGADHHLIIERMFFSKPLSHVTLESDVMLNHLKTGLDGRYAWFFLSPDLIRKHSIDLKDTEGLIDCVRQLDGVKVAALFYLREDGVKFSMRSKDTSVSVGAIARRHNGGGHELAAGGIIKGLAFEAAEKVIFDEVASVLA